MIKIENPNLDDIIEKHRIACVNYIKPRLQFYVDLFNALGNKMYLDKSISLSAKYDLHGNTLRSLIKPILKKEYKSSKKTWNQNHIKTILTKGTKVLVSKDITPSRFKILYDFFVEIHLNLKTLIDGNPVELFNISNKFNKTLTKYKLLQSIIVEVFSYGTFSTEGFHISKKEIWNSYSLTEALKLSVCPYCNRNWIVTVQDEGKIVNPQIDHFFEQAKHPLLRLSFYNLIPSCEACNARLKPKFKNGFTLENLHPYLEGYGDNAKFKVQALDAKSAKGFDKNFDVSINITTDDSEIKEKIELNHDIFEIDEIEVV
jgi:hypothetical protein